MTSALSFRLQNPDGRRYHPVTRTFHSFPLFLALSRLLRIAEKVPFFLLNDVLVCSSFYLLDLSLPFQFYHYRLQRGFLCRFLSIGFEFGFEHTQTHAALKQSTIAGTNGTGQPNQPGGQTFKGCYGISSFIIQ